MKSDCEKGHSLDEMRERREMSSATDLRKLRYVLPSGRELTVVLDPDQGLAETPPRLNSVLGQLEAR